MELIRNFILELGFFELLFALLFLLVSPIILWWRGSNELESKYGRRSIGICYKIGAVALTLVDLALLVVFGKDIWYHVSSSFGPTIKGLLIAAIVCVVLFPVCYAGSMFRSMFEAMKIIRSDPTKRVKRRSKIKAMLSGIALIIITVAGFLFLPIKLAIILSGTIVVALTIGWFGSFLVPDV
jgi:hypothetical protein